MYTDIITPHILVRIPITACVRVIVHFRLNILLNPDQDFKASGVSQGDNVLGFTREITSGGIMPYIRVKPESHHPTYNQLYSAQSSGRCGTFWHFLQYHEV